MMRGAPVLFAATAVFLGAQNVLACDFYMQSTFHNIPTAGWAVGAGMQLNTAGSSNTTIFSGDISVKLGTKAVVRPAAGICRGGGHSEAIFGGGVGVNLWNNPAGTLALNGQSGVTILSSSGSTHIGIPIVGALNFSSSDAMSIFGGGGLQHSRASGHSATDPILFGGVGLGVGTMDLTGGISMYMGGSTETSFNAGISIPMGN